MRAQRTISAGIMALALVWGLAGTRESPGTAHGAGTPGVAAPMVTVPGAPNCPIFPATNVWNTDISRLPVARNSAQLIAAIGLDRGLHPDFDTDPRDGIPYQVVSDGVPKARVAFDYTDESDPGPYPIPAHPLVEGGGSGDAHILIVDRDTCHLYELYAAQHTARGWHAGSGAIWNLRSNALRPDGWTSADAAGLPILPGLVRYDEVARGVINHALRFTAPRTRRAHIYPARHDAGASDDPGLPPMGLRVRLKASFNIAGFSPQARVVLQALKRYGMLLADNGSPWYITGAPGPRWDDEGLHLLNHVTGADLEVVDTSRLRNGP